MVNISQKYERELAQPLSILPRREIGKEKAVDLLAGPAVPPACTLEQVMASVASGQSIQSL